jgi:hypothetical protein
MPPMADEMPIPPAVLLSNDSPLRRLPTALHRRQQLALDGISMSADMTALSYQQLQAALWLHSKAIDQTTSRLAAVHAVTNAWAIIDAAHRVRVLVRKLPGLKRGPAVVSFLKIAEQVEPLRNAVQHLDGAIEELLANGRPVWGVLSWVNVDSPDAKRFSVRALLPGTMAPTSASVVNPMGRAVEIPIGLVTLEAAEMTVCLSDVVQAVERFTGRLERAAGATFPTIPEGAANVVAKLELPVDKPS